MQDEILEIIVVMALCTTKFMAGVLLSLTQGWNYPLTLGVTVFGGMVGVVAYDLLLLEAMQLYYRLRKKEPKVKISRVKKLVRLRQRMGLIGIVILTPIFLQVPLGTILAGTIERNFKKLALYMFISFTLYTTLFYYLFHVLNVDVGAILKEWLEWVL